MPSSGPPLPVTAAPPFAAAAATATATAAVDDDDEMVDFILQDQAGLEKKKAQDLQKDFIQQEEKKAQRKVELNVAEEEIETAVYNEGGR